MSTSLLRSAADCGIALVLLVALAFLLHRLGWDIRIWRASRGQRQNQDSSANRYWSLPE